MNERIKQLAVEAGLLPREIGPVVETRHMKKKEQDIEKFAELIVQECMTICKEHPSRIVSNNWVADAVAPDIVSQFEEHFGVEE